MPIALTPDEWEWFKRLSRKASPPHDAPAAIESKLVELQLMRLNRHGGLRPTARGRDVLKLVGMP